MLRWSAFLFACAGLMLAFLAAHGAASAAEERVRIDSLSAAEIAPGEAAAFRKATFGGLQKRLRALSEIAKGDAYDQEEVTRLVEEIVVLARDIPHGFGPGTENLRKSRAKEEIWQEGSDFVSLAASLGAAAESALDAGISRATLGDALSALGGRCQACHSRYRARR